MYPRLEIVLERTEPGRVGSPLHGGVGLDLLGLLNAGDDGLPGLLQRLYLDGAGGGELRRQLGLVGGVLRVFEQHLIGALVQGLHGLGLDFLPLEEHRLGQGLLEDRQGDDKGGVDLADQI